jgi:hypothetical protein
MIEITEHTSSVPQHVLVDRRSFLVRSIIAGSGLTAASFLFQGSGSAAVRGAPLQPPARAGIERFHLAVPQRDLDDLHRRLARTRWPDAPTVGDWSQGAKLKSVEALCEYWRTRYNWRRCETMLNGFGQYRTRIDGLGIHFLHARSAVPDAVPLIITHGWPGSVIEFHKVIGP